MKGPLALQLDSLLLNLHYQNKQIVTALSKIKKSQSLTIKQSPNQSQTSLYIIHENKLAKSQINKSQNKSKTFHRCNSCKLIASEQNNNKKESKIIINKKTQRMSSNYQIIKRQNKINQTQLICQSSTKQNTKSKVEKRVNEANFIMKQKPIRHNLQQKDRNSNLKQKNRQMGKQNQTGKYMKMLNQKRRNNTTISIN